uniref:Transposase n=1 Tax=Mesocestoides corti TaxID=53468 RepID=A0A5K3FE99_MESCO
MPLDRRETRDWLRPGGPTCLRPNPTPLQNTRALISQVFQDVCALIRRHTTQT